MRSQRRVRNQILQAFYHGCRPDSMPRHNIETLYCDCRTTACPNTNIHKYPQALHSDCHAGGVFVTNINKHYIAIAFPAVCPNTIIINFYVEIAAPAACAKSNMLHYIMIAAPAACPDTNIYKHYTAIADQTTEHKYPQAIHSDCRAGSVSGYRYAIQHPA